MHTTSASMQGCFRAPRAHLAVARHACTAPRPASRALRPSPGVVAPPLPRHQRRQVRCNDTSGSNGASSNGVGKTLEQVRLACIGTSAGLLRIRHEYASATRPQEGCVLPLLRAGGLIAGTEAAASVVGKAVSARAGSEGKRGFVTVGSSVHKM